MFCERWLAVVSTEVSINGIDVIREQYLKKQASIPHIFFVRNKIAGALDN